MSEEERSCSHKRRVTHLQHQQHQEVSVGDPLELLKQIDGQEGEDVVL